MQEKYLGQDILRGCFWLHDVSATFLTKNLFTLKKGILIFAHLSLIGFLWPELRKDYGSWAGNLLIFILFLSPLAKITRMRLLNQLMSLRREMGILMGYFALVHGLGYITDARWQAFVSTMPFDGFFSGKIAFFYGFLALLLTLPLLLTSNAWAQRRLGRWWKRIHKVVYAVFALAVLHRFLLRGDFFSLLQAGFLIGAYILLKLLAWRNFWPGLNHLLIGVGQQYKEYVLQKKQAL
jgi:DMSO/TMAO reductase YedYZ heme-binding membrane subunit